MTQQFAGQFAEQFAEQSTEQSTEQFLEQRQEQYLSLIDQLFTCPGGQEPEILDAHPDLIDAGLVQTLVKVGTVMAHQENQDGAKFLFHVARELAIQLGLYSQH